MMPAKPDGLGMYGENAQVVKQSALQEHARMPGERATPAKKMEFCFSRSGKWRTDDRLFSFFCILLTKIDIFYISMG